MPRTVRQTGIITGQAERLNAKRNVLYAANGNVLVVVYDPNEATASGDDTGVGKFYLYESSDRITFNLRATFTPTIQPQKGTLNDSPGYYITADLFSDNSVGIAWLGNNGTLKYRKITYSTWAVSAEETIVAAVGGTAVQLEIDMSINAQGAVLVANVYSTTTNGSYYQWRLFIRTTAAAWGQCGATTVVHPSNQLIPLTHDVSVTWIGGAAASARTFALSYSSATSNNDFGTRIWVGKISETTVGAITGLTQVGGSLQTDLITTAGAFYVWQPRRSWLFKDELANSVTVGIITTAPKIVMTMLRFTYDGTTIVTTIPATDRIPKADPQSVGVATYGPGAINFLVITWWATYNGAYTSNYVFRVDSGGFSTDVKKHFWDGKTSKSNENVYGGTGVNAGLAGNTKHDSGILNRISNVNYFVQHEWAGAQSSTLTGSPSSPVSGSQTDDPTPLLAAKSWLFYWPSSRVRMRWQFARDSSFTTSPFVYDSAVWGLASNEGSAGVGGADTIQDTLPDALALAGGTWYFREALVDEFGNVMPYSTTRTLIELHIPSAFNPEPAGSDVIVYPSSGNVTFTWQFSDPWDQDHQTAYQIICERNDTGATVFDTGKTTGTGQQHVQNISGTLAEVVLRWRVRVWDVDDNVSPYTDNELFTLAVPPTVAVNAPTEGQVVASATPAIQFTPDTAGGRTIYRYRVRVTQGLTLLHDSSWVYGSWADLTLMTYNPGQAILKLTNSQAYTVQVIVEDSFGLQGNTYVHFTTSWATPAVPSTQAVSITNYNIVGAGYNRVSWADTGRDANFQQWNVYRRDDLIDPNTQAVLVVGTWTLIGFVTSTNVAGYTFDDYYAPSGYKTVYQVTQMTNNLGQIAESALGAGTAVFPVSDGYWIINPNATVAADTAFKLSIVTADSFNDEVEEETYNILNRGRYVEKGTRFGFIGSLTAQIRDDTVMSARQRRVRLLELRETNDELFLRNPFGDTFRITVGSIQVDRIAGVGKSEFVDVTIPYQEVAS